MRLPREQPPAEQTRLSHVEHLDVQRDMVNPLEQTEHVAVPAATALRSPADKRASDAALVKSTNVAWMRGLQSRHMKPSFHPSEGTTGRSWQHTRHTERWHCWQ